MAPALDHDAPLTAEGSSPYGLPWLQPVQRGMKTTFATVETDARSMRPPTARQRRSEICRASSQTRMVARRWWGVDRFA